MTPLSNDNDNHLMLTSHHRRRSLSEGQSGISPVQEAMIEHLAYIVLAEGRPARTRDFLNFEVNGVAYSLKPGTIRNHLSHLRRLGEIEIDCKSVCTFYTLPGYRRQTLSTMTPDHTSVISGGRRDLASLIQRLAFGTASVHNVRLRFTVAGIYDALSILSSPSTKVSSADAVARIDTRPSQNAATLASLSTTKRSKDLVLRVMRLDKGLAGKVTVHRGDTVSVILGCSEMPIRLDIGGLVRLTSSLTRIEERLASLIDTAMRRHAEVSDGSAERLSSSPAANFAANATSADSALPLAIPECGSWIVTMWHIGFDSLERYAGEKFEVAWEDFKGEWIRVYSKQKMINSVTDTKGRKGKKRPIIRIEKQEYPNDTLHDAVEARLSSLSIRNK
jgi:hypothetical protein